MERVKLIKPVKRITPNGQTLINGKPLGAWKWYVGKIDEKVECLSANGSILYGIIVDLSDPALVTCETPIGARFKQGRWWVRPSKKMS